MEFYIKENLSRNPLARVSIPNGMEFYFNLSRDDRIALVVSIPNGMEFYASSRFFGRLYIESFNSQRDGILRKL